MSYSFSVTASTKDEAKRMIAEQFALVAKQQPRHAADEAAAVAAGKAFVDLLTDIPDGHEVYVSMYGSLGWNNDAPDKYLSASASVNASVRKVATPAGGPAPAPAASSTSAPPHP